MCTLWIREHNDAIRSLFMASWKCHGGEALPVGLGVWSSAVSLGRLVFMTAASTDFQARFITWDKHLTIDMSAITCIFEMSMIPHLIHCSTWWNCIPCCPNNCSMLIIKVSLLEALSNFIHPICKTISSVSLLKIWGHSEWSSSNRNSLTLLVMLRWSVINRSACAKFSPSWQPGTCWKSMRSACSELVDVVIA